MTLPTMVLLASASIRRASWLGSHLKDADVEFSAAPLLTSEKPSRSGISVRQQVEETLAAKVEAAKMESYIAREAGQSVPDITIVADTLVEDPDEPTVSLGKPPDRASAAVMLFRLQDRRHLVWSGTALLEPSESGWKEMYAVEFATVDIDPLSAEQIEALLASGSWVGKAGAYDIAGEMGAHARVVSGEEVCVLGLASSVIEFLDATLSGKP